MIALRTERLEVGHAGPGVLRVRTTPLAGFPPERPWSIPPGRGDSGLSFHVTEDSRLVFLFEGTEFAADLAAASHTWDGAGEEPALDPALHPLQRHHLTVSLGKRLHPDEVLYGFGQRTMKLDRRGNRLTNWTVDPESGQSRGHDNLYQAHPFFMAHRPGFTWGLLLNCTWWSQFDAGHESWDELWIRARGGVLDYFLLAGRSPAEVLDRYTALVGRPMLPPLWALGYHQSRWGYCSQAEIEDLARQFRERDLPLDAVHLDIDHMRDYRSLTFDPERFPRPAELTRTLAARGARAVTIVDPGIKLEHDRDYPLARQLKEKRYHLSRPDGSPYVGYCWPDAALFPDFVRHEVRDWWGDQFEGFLELGVSGFWLDMNEPANFDRPFSQKEFQQNPLPLDLPQADTVHAEAHNLYGLMMSRATRQGLAKLRPDRRPWILTRSGFPGIGREAAVWMGDNSSWFEHLELSFPQLLSMGLCGVPHAGVDIGGFFQNCDGELFARWIEAGVLYPFMRTHSAWGTRDQEPWSFGPEVE
ncbi:MAG: TIM-barrel domain-containing protein, partial [Candidatus Eremiobacterota bacterium]